MLQGLAANEKLMRNDNYALGLGGSLQVLEKTRDTCCVDELACSGAVSGAPQLVI